MGVPILILGESGTGKTTSLRNFTDEIALVNVTGKPLPFRKSFENISGTTDFDKISRFMKQTDKKIIVVDDCQYIMSFQYMRRIKENGWDKFNEIQSDFFNLIDLAFSLPEDVIVYFLSHIETRDDGRQKIKTIGKMLDEKITIEGMFTTVLKTHCSDGKYYFLTQNSGSDTVKSPLGMFDTYAIDNDLKYVDDKIRNYYQIGDCKTDEEMAEEDATAERPEVEKGGRSRTGRRRSAGADKSTPDEEKPADVALKPDFAEVDKEAGLSDDDFPFTVGDEEAKPEEPKRRRRKERE